MLDRRRRATATRVHGRARAAYLAGRLGIALLACRIALNLTQAEAARRAGVSQSFWSRIERGRVVSASLETLAACAAAVEAQFSAFIEARPGADLPHDLEHLRRQELIVRIARPGGWTARPERPIDPSWSRSRSIDVLLERSAAGRREAAVVEVEDLLVDVGAALRGLADKTAAIRREHLAATGGASGPVVAGLLVIRGTVRNRTVVDQIRALLESRFPAAGSAWLAALGEPGRPMPEGDGWVWSSVAGDRLMAPRHSGPAIRPQPRAGPGA